MMNDTTTLAPPVMHYQPAAPWRQTPNAMDPMFWLTMDRFTGRVAHRADGCAWTVCKDNSRIANGNVSCHAGLADNLIVGLAMESAENALRAAGGLQHVGKWMSGETDNG